MEEERIAPQALQEVRVLTIYIQVYPKINTDNPRVI